MYDSMLHMQMQEACHAAQPRLRGQLGGDAAVRRLPDHATARSAWSAPSRRTRCATSRKALELDEDLSLRPEFADPRGAGRAPARAAGDLPGPVRRRTPPSTGSSALEEATSSARRCARWPRRSRTSRRWSTHGRRDGAPDRRHGAGARTRRSTCPATPAHRAGACRRGSGEHNDEVLSDHGYDRRRGRRLLPRRGCSDDRRRRSRTRCARARRATSPG